MNASFRESKPEVKDVPHARADGVLDRFCFDSPALRELARESDRSTLRASAVTSAVVACLLATGPLDEDLERVPGMDWATTPKVVFGGIVGFCDLSLVEVTVPLGVAAFCFLAAFSGTDITVEFDPVFRSIIFALGSSEAVFCSPV